MGGVQCDSSDAEFFLEANDATSDARNREDRLGSMAGPRSRSSRISASMGMMLSSTTTGSRMVTSKLAILDNIRARAHFVVLLTPTALERCGDPADRLRREVEPALECRRHIVPPFVMWFQLSGPNRAAHRAVGAVASRADVPLSRMVCVCCRPSPEVHRRPVAGRLRATALGVTELEFPAHTRHSERQARGSGSSLPSSQRSAAGVPWI